jgi:YVTN family beta-propeller protein
LLRDALAAVRALAGVSQPGINPARSGKNSLSQCEVLWKSITSATKSCVNNAYEREMTNPLLVTQHSSREITQRAASGFGARFGTHLAVLICTALMLGGCGKSESPDPSATQTSQAQRAVNSARSYRVYVTNERSGDLSVIDGESHELLATVPLGKRPRGIQVSPDGKQLFIALSGSPIAGPGVDESKLPPADPSADGIGIVDIETMKLQRVLRGVSDPEQMVVSKDGKHLYIASEDTGTAVIMNVATGERIAALPVGGEPEGVGISPDGRFVYMTSEEDHQVSVISTADQTVIQKFEVGQRPRQAAFSSDGSRAYVTGEMDATVALVDALAHKVIHTIQLSGEMVRPMEVDLSPDDQIIYVTTGRGGTLVAIDAASFEPLNQVTVGARPWGLAISPDGKYLYTANGPSNDVSVVDAKSFKVVTKVPVGTSPWGVVTVE